jgi:membrane-associated protein
VPIVRTLAPFVAGMDAMPYQRFLPLSVIGAITWVGICVYSGYFFGGIPWVTDNFSIVVMLIVGASLGLIFVEFFRSVIKARRAAK